MAERDPPRRKGGKKNRKHGRDRRQCEFYRLRGQREKNKIKKLAKHVIRHPRDLVGITALEGLRGRRKAAS